MPTARGAEEGGTTVRAYSPPGSEWFAWQALS
jgi:hypothetical protein